MIDKCILQNLNFSMRSHMAIKMDQSSWFSSILHNPHLRTLNTRDANNYMWLAVRTAAAQNGSRQPSKPVVRRRAALSIFAHCKSGRPWPLLRVETREKAPRGSGFNEGGLAASLPRDCLYVESERISFGGGRRFSHLNDTRFHRWIAFLRETPRGVL